MMKLRNLLSVSVVSAFIVGCETVPELIDESNDLGHTTEELDYRDWEKAATNMVADLVASGAVSRPGKPYVLAVGRVINKTQEVIDTDLLIKKIRVALVRMGKVRTTTAYGIAGPEDEMTRLVQEEVGAPDTTVLPELSLTGKIIQPTSRHYESGLARRECYFQLTLTDLKTGLTVWEDERKVIKQVSSQSVSW